MPPKNIARIDADKSHQHCWEVKIVRVPAENSFHRSFSDAKYGGKQAALAAAIKCRDEELKTRPPLNAYQQAIKPKRTNKSGIVGVRRGVKSVRRGNKLWEYDAWVVTGTPGSGGKTKTKYFVLHVHGGSIAAKALAIEQRKEWEESLRKSVEAKIKAAQRECQKG
jgi:hypothetical protein